MKNFWSTQLKIMLGAMAAQHFQEYLSDEDKRAALDKLMADIEREKTPQQDETPARIEGVEGSTEFVRHSF